MIIIYTIIIISSRSLRVQNHGVTRRFLSVIIYFKTPIYFAPCVGHCCRWDIEKVARII